MQRTVHTTIYTYAKTEIVEGKLTATLAKIEVPETDEKRAYKQAVKMLGHTFQPLAVEKATKLYVLDDEIFFKYATIATDTNEPQTPEN